MIIQSERELEHKHKRQARLINIALLILLFTTALIALCIGKYPLKPLSALAVLFGKANLHDVMDYHVVLGLRLPRIIASIICGAALASSGTAYQGIFKNPLVSSEFLGVSQGACVGAAIAILLSASAAQIQLFAFLGGLLAVGLTLLIPALMRNNSNLMLVLSGIIIGGAMSSVLGFIKYIADPETELAAITYWQMGSFSYITSDQLASVLLPMGLASLCLFGLSWRIDILSLGESEAQTLGTNVPLVRIFTIICATLLTASSVSIAGTISWVGLIIPHFGRILVGTGNTRLLPTACLGGALFLLTVDTVTRTATAAEMPISILTGLIGAPLYAWLLYKRRMIIN
ncbi:MAG TPA: iron ABC transporter permease [Oscillospiraceae bacterium]|nr:iron ABC transporter permease [Oscillospiraceae bacterium]